MGAIAEAIMAYTLPLIDETDGSFEQLQKALSMGQLCWNLAITPEEDRQSVLDAMRSGTKMSEADFNNFKRSVVQPMIRRHEEMFPKLHQPDGIKSPHWEEAQPAPRLSSPQEHGHPLPQPVLPLSLDEALHELDDAYGTPPQAAIRACQANRDLSIPRLIGVLENVVRACSHGDEPEGNATICALFLLAEFKATEAIPAIWRFLKLPRGVPETLLGDAITEDLPRILAIFAHSRLELLDELVRDPSHNQWVRSAALGAAQYLVRDRVLSRQDAVSWMRAHLAEAIQRRDPSITDALIGKLLSLNANEARAEMEQAFQEGLVDEWMVSRKDVHDQLRPDRPDECNDAPHHTPTEIADTLEELRGWHWQSDSSDEFDDDATEDDGAPGLGTPFHLPRSAAERFATVRSQVAPFGGGQEGPTSFTLRHDARRVGRNEPCPCGSGKKYKKCCLRNSPSD